MLESSYASSTYRDQQPHSEEIAGNRTFSSPFEFPLTPCFSRVSSRTLRWDFPATQSVHLAVNYYFLNL